MLNQLLADVYVFTDHMSGPEAGASPGYGVMLVAETTAGRLISAEACATAATMVRTLPGHQTTGASQKLLGTGMCQQPLSALCLSKRSSSLFVKKGCCFFCSCVRTQACKVSV